MKRCVVMYSGGAASHHAAIRAITRYERENVVLLFSDTGRECPTTYDFVQRASQHLGARLVKVSLGIPFFDFVRQQRTLPNDRMPFCSRKLKVEPAVKWVAQHEPDAAIVLGLDWSEPHRFEPVRQRWAGHEVWFPLSERPYLTKKQMLEQIKESGLPIPALYLMGFQHNNCGGGCVRQGKAGWAHLWRTCPEEYAEWEALEQEPVFQGHTIMKGMSLRHFGKMLSLQGTFDQFDWGGCGCFADDPELDQEVPS